MCSESKRVVKLLVFLLLLKVKGFEIGGGATEVSRFTPLFMLYRHLLVLLSVKNDPFPIEHFNSWVFLIPLSAV